MTAAPLPPEIPTQPADFSLAASRTLTACASRAWRQIGYAMGWPQRPKKQPIVASEARAAFVACLADVPTLQARALSERLSHTRSLSELWHLRPAVFQLLALHHSQAEAQRRLALLGQRFDRRAKPRPSGPPTHPA